MKRLVTLVAAAALAVCLPAAHSAQTTTTEVKTPVGKFSLEITAE